MVRIGYPRLIVLPHAEPERRGAGLLRGIHHSIHQLLREPTSIPLVSRNVRAERCF